MGSSTGTSSKCEGEAASNVKAIIFEMNSLDKKVTANVNKSEATSMKEPSTESAPVPEEAQKKVVCRRARRVICTFANSLSKLENKYQSYAWHMVR